MSATVLTLDHVTSGYGSLTVLRDVDATVGAGEMVAVLGSNGAGKSTLLKTVVGLLRPRSGRILGPSGQLSGRSADSIARSGVILVPEGRQLFASMTVLDNLLLGWYARGGSRAERRAQMKQVFDLFPILEERPAMPAGSMSGGQQQMLAIGRALMARPKVLLLDEPSLGLAPMVLKHVFEALQRLRELEVTILLVEQNAKMTLDFADRAYVLERGRVVVEGPASALAQDPRIQQIYLGLADHAH
jgi:branched-chain amino acid transport system ATP-binding protein